MKLHADLWLSFLKKKKNTKDAVFVFPTSLPWNTKLLVLRSISIFPVKVQGLKNASQNQVCSDPPVSCPMWSSQAAPVQAAQAARSQFPLLGSNWVLLKPVSWTQLYLTAKAFLGKQWSPAACEPAHYLFLFLFWFF